MDITCVADLHGHYPNLEGGDLLIVAGDLTSHDRPHQLIEFGAWLDQQNYEQKVVVGGNHDCLIEAGRWEYSPPSEYGWEFDYLCDSGIKFKGLKIWGSPWTSEFEGINPKCKAFTCGTDERLALKWLKIPSDTDILITHSPPYGIFDNPDCDGVGSKSLLIRSLEIRPLLHVFGHIHEQGGNFLQLKRSKKNTWEKRHTTYCNASHVDEYYKPIHKPVRIEL